MDNLAACLTWPNTREWSINYDGRWRHVQYDWHRVNNIMRSNRIRWKKVLANFYENYFQFWESFHMLTLLKTLFFFQINWWGSLFSRNVAAMVELKVHALLFGFLVICLMRWATSNHSHIFNETMDYHAQIRAEIYKFMLVTELWDLFYFPFTLSF